MLTFLKLSIAAAPLFSLCLFKAHLLIKSSLLWLARGVVQLVDMCI